MLSMTTDYKEKTGSARMYLKRIAEAGFTHVHWCHEWHTDYRYSVEEVRQIAGWLKEYHLQLVDLHASNGQAAGDRWWVSADTAVREAGCALIGNRIEMAEYLGSDVIVVQLPRLPETDEQQAAYWEGLHQSLYDVRPLAGKQGVRIALENVPNTAAGRPNDNFGVFEKLFSDYPGDFIGLCYDSGHGNIDGKGLDRLDRLKDRLIAVHLHDNDGTADQHRLPFSGTVDWARLLAVMAASSYRKGISLESNMNSYPEWPEDRFLEEAYRAALRLERMQAKGE